MKKLYEVSYNAGTVRVFAYTEEHAQEIAVDVIKNLRMLDVTSAQEIIECQSQSPSQATDIT